MKRYFAARLLYLVLFLAVVSCAPTPTEASLPATVPPVIVPSPAGTMTTLPTATITATKIPPTNTPIPCDPLHADFCISGGQFILRRPILPPGNASVDISYRYGTTAKRERDPHHGVEFLNKFGAPVYAAGDGEVVFAEMDEVAVYSPWRIFYGNVVVIRHADELYTLYAHLSQIDVSPGRQVRTGDKIGNVGQTGAAIGSHLHFEVRRWGDGTDYFSTENPELWLFPLDGLGTISITVRTNRSTKFERDIVVTGSGDANYYVSTYAKGFEHNLEDVVIGDLPPGEYRIAFVEAGAFYERRVEVQAGKLTEVVFAIGQ